MSWADDLRKLTTKGGQDLGELCKTIKVEIFSGIVSDTRVDTGRLRGNWQIQENAPASDDIKRRDVAGSGKGIEDHAIIDMQKEIDSKATGIGNTFFVNNLPYAKVYEQEDAMIARNIARVKNEIGKMARDIKG